jgi:ferritin-like metal-binding protein YciE
MKTAKSANTKAAKAVKAPNASKASSHAQAATLEELFAEELKDLYDAEQQILDALPEVSAAASSSELKSVLDDHRRLTRKHVERLEQVFELRGVEPERKKCRGVAGLLAEGESLVKADMPAEIKDAALISAAQRVEHYEMAVYGSLRTYAQLLGDLESARLLQSTLDEEGDADRTLTQLAEFSINLEAARHSNGGVATAR